MNVAFDSAVDLGDRHFDDRFRDLSASADDQRTVLGGNNPSEVSVDAQHRFEAHFTGEIHHVTDKAKPIILIDIGPLTINKCSHCAAPETREGKKEIA